MSHHYQITVAELETLMRDALSAAGFAPDYLERYVEAHKNFGWLRPNTSEEILALAEIHYTLPPASGFGPVIPPLPGRKHRQR
jgi:hypothetical protein